MARIFTNGNVAIRVHDIVAVGINDDDPSFVVIFTKNPIPFTFRCTSKKNAKNLFNSIVDEMEREL